ncbi:hypothetical protein ACHZ98_26405 [Streptomyces sp. MAR4 CNY-716]
MPRKRETKGFAAGITPPERELAEQVKGMLQVVGRASVSNDAAAKKLNYHGASVSRYVRGVRLASAAFIRCLHAEATRVTGGSPGLTLEELIALREEARQARKHREARNLLAGPSPAAGVSLFYDARNGHVPGSGSSADRQRTASDLDDQYARSLARQVAEFHSHGHLASVAALLAAAVHTASPADIAATVSLLRRNEDHPLADSLIQMCGRDRSPAQVVSVAHELHRCGSHVDAGILLHAAVTAAQPTKTTPIAGG